MAERTYTRLTRSRLRSSFAVAITARSSLWLGPDHLLCLDTNGYSETYKRYYFRDIQALTIVRTQRRQLWNWALGTGLGLCLGVWVYLLLASGLPGLGWVGGGAGITLLFAGLLVLNNVLGPTCVCELRTAVQTEDLAPIRRVFRARRLLARLQPLITAAQGELTPAAASADIPTGS